MLPYIEIMQVLKIVLAATIVLDIIVLFLVIIARHRWDKILMTYAITTIFLVTWEISLWMSYFLKTQRFDIQIVDYSMFITGGIGVVFSLYFIWLLAGSVFISKAKMYLFIIMGVIVSCIGGIPHVVIDGRKYFSELTIDYTLVPGPLFLLYHMLIGSYLLVLVYIYIRAYKKTTGLQHMRFKIVGIGVLIPIVLGLLTAAWWPLFDYLFFINEEDSLRLMNVMQILAAISMSIFSLSIAYAITRYRFMDIRIMLRKSVVYGLALVVSLGVLLGLTMSVYLATQSMFVWFVCLALVIMFGEKWKRWVKQRLDGVFFMDQLDLSKQISTRAEKLNSTKETDAFVDELVRALYESAKVSVARVFVLERKNVRLRAYYPQDVNAHISSDDAGVRALVGRSGVILADELEQDQQPHARALLKLLRTYHSSAIMSIEQGNDILAIIFLEGKRDQQPWYTNDIQRLEALIQRSSNHLAAVLYWQDTIEQAKLTIKEQEYSV